MHKLGKYLKKAVPFLAETKAFLPYQTLWKAIINPSQLKYSACKFRGWTRYSEYVLFEIILKTD